MIISGLESGSVEVVFLGNVSYVKVIHQIVMAIVGHKELHFFLQKGVF